MCRSVNGSEDEDVSEDTGLGMEIEIDGTQDNNHNSCIEDTQVQQSTEFQLYKTHRVLYSTGRQHFTPNAGWRRQVRQCNAAISTINQLFSGSRIQMTNSSKVLSYPKG